MSYNTQRPYQKIMFSDEPMKTTFRYNLQNSKEERKFYVPLRPENVAKTGLDPDKIRKSFTQTSTLLSLLYSGYPQPGPRLEWIRLIRSPKPHIWGPKPRNRVKQKSR